MNIDSTTDIRIRIYNTDSRPWGTGGHSCGQTDKIMDPLFDIIWDFGMQILAGVKQDRQYGTDINTENPRGSYFETSSTA